MCTTKCVDILSLFRLLAERLQRAEHEAATGKANIQTVMEEKMEAEKSVTMLRIDYKEVLISCTAWCNIFTTIILTGCQEKSRARSFAQTGEYNLQYHRFRIGHFSHELNGLIHSLSAFGLYDLYL